MAPIVRNWRSELMRAHPRRFLTMTEEPSRSFGYPHCERGWRNIRRYDPRDRHVSDVNPASLGIEE
jgi:hypothetical protein